MWQQKNAIDGGQFWSSLMWRDVSAEWRVYRARSSAARSAWQRCSGSTFHPSCFTPHLLISNRPLSHNTFLWLSSKILCLSCFCWDTQNVRTWAQVKWNNSLISNSGSSTGIESESKDVGGGFYLSRSCRCAIIQPVAVILYFWHICFVRQQQCLSYLHTLWSCWNLYISVTWWKLHNVLVCCLMYCNCNGIPTKCEFAVSKVQS